MNWVRGFSGKLGEPPETRSLEDAPEGMRQELVDLWFGLSEHHDSENLPEHIYRVSCQSLGLKSSGVPYSGFRYAAGRDVAKVDWPRVYDLVGRLWKDFDRIGLGRQFRDGANRIFSAYGVAWEITEDGRISRVLPEVAQHQVEAAIAELSDPRFQPALDLFKAARDAYDARPRRDRDACSNAFDAAESAAKERFEMPQATFGQVVHHLRQRAVLNEQVIGVLESINTLRNKNFGHGMTTPFSLSGPEVDFSFLTCVGVILLFARMR